jgi:hypothetical protein
LSRYGAFVVLRAALEDKVQAQSMGRVGFHGVEAEDVLVTVPPATLHVFITPDGKEVMGAKRTGKTQAGPADIVEVFSGYQEFSGLRFPTEIRQETNGETAATIKISSIKINAGFSEDLFKKPPSDQGGAPREKK